MLYAILCYNSEEAIAAWPKDHHDQIMGQLGAVQDKLNKQGRLGPVARLLPTTAATTLRKGREDVKDEPGAFAGFLGAFLVLFLATGIGNASTFQMIPAICAKEMLRLMPQADACRRLDRQAGAGRDHHRLLAHGEVGARRRRGQRSFGAARSRTQIAARGGFYAGLCRRRSSVPRQAQAELYGPALNELSFEHDPIRKPVPTFRDHAPSPPFSSINFAMVPTPSPERLCASGI